MLFTLPWVGALFLALLASAYSGLSNGESQSQKPIAPTVRPLMAFCAGCLLLPVCGAVITTMKFGLIVGLPLLIGLAGARKVIGLALFAAMGGNAALVAAKGAMRLRSREAPFQAVAQFRRLIPEPHPDIVLPETNVFPPMVETNRNDPENSLLYLFDTAKQLAIRGSDSPAGMLN
jgi:hypothetical protein